MDRQTPHRKFNIKAAFQCEALEDVTHKPALFKLFIFWVCFDFMDFEGKRTNLEARSAHT